MLLMGAAGCMGMAEDAMPPAEMFKIERVSKRVYAAIARLVQWSTEILQLLSPKKDLSLLIRNRIHLPHIPLQFAREAKDLLVRFLISTHHHLDHAHASSEVEQICNYYVRQ